MSICTAPIYKLDKFRNLFIELTAKNCNQRCNVCYIDFPINKNINDFISLDSIKEALEDTKHENIECIYLTGGEPMTHPNFNLILRLCLKRCNVCICTNSSFLNEKKVRFLKKVEDEGESFDINNQIFFSLSLTHFDELENDKVKYRGNFRQTISALKILNRYNFATVLNIQNVYQLSELVLKEKFLHIFNINEISNTELKINVSYPNQYEQNEINVASSTDCMYGRILTKNGIYACPFLANDYRGRMGASFKNFSKTISAETDFCTTCSLNQKQIFGIC